MFKHFYVHHFAGGKRKFDDSHIELSSLKINNLPPAKKCEYTGLFRAFDSTQTKMGIDYTGVLVNNKLSGYMSENDIHIIQNKLKKNQPVTIRQKNINFISLPNLERFKSNKSSYLSFDRKMKFRTDYSLLVQAFLHQ